MTIGTIGGAYWYAFDNHTKPDFDLNYYQKKACKDPYYAYIFALNIPGANIWYCQERACKDPGYALWFAQNIQGSDIEYCRKVCESDPYWLDEFDKMIIEKAML